MTPTTRRVSVALGSLAVAAGIGSAAYLAADDEATHKEPEASSAEATMAAVVYRSPTCGCCENYVEYFRRHDVEVEDEVTDDVDSVKAEHGVPADVEGCHTALIDGYVVEGHVPLEAIEKLLDERPDIDGIAVPGMPANSPGMGEPDGQPLEVVSFDDGQVSPFMTL